MRGLSPTSVFQTPTAQTVTSSPSNTHQEDREWTISEMARHYGMTLRALRFYEARGLLKPYRFGGARYYTARDRIRLAQVLAAKQMGFTLTETAEMIGKTPDGAADLPLSPGAVSSQISFLESQRNAIEGALKQLRDRLKGMSLT